MKLRDVRIKARLSQYEVAKRAGIDRSTYTHIERGRIPSLRSAVAICRTLGVKVEDIFHLE